MVVHQEVQKLKIDTSSFLHKPFLRTNWFESNIEEDLDLKNQFRNENLPDPTTIREVASNCYVDSKCDDPGIVKNSAHVDLNDKSLDNVRFIKLNSYPATGDNATAEYYVDQNTDEPTLVKFIRSNDFNNH